MYVRRDDVLLVLSASSSLCVRIALIAAGDMLWFQGSIPEAIAAAKEKRSIFVVFVAGEGKRVSDRDGGCKSQCGLPGHMIDTQGAPD